MKKEEAKTPFLTVDAIIFNGNEEIALVKRKNPPHGWALPWGFVEIGESCEEAVIREVKEETGLDLEEVEQFKVYSKRDRDPRFHAVTVVFDASVKEGSIAKSGSDAKEVKFFNFENLPELAFNHKEIIEDILSFVK